jgi:hypothetical protein
MSQNEDNKSTSLILDYPDPRTLPAPPSLHEPIPLVTLSELEPGKYISTLARIVYLKTVEKLIIKSENNVTIYQRDYFVSSLFI